MSGGALVVRNSKFKVQNLEIKNISVRQQWKDRRYPLFTFKIRKTYALSLGKILHVILKRLNYLSNPMSYLGMGDIHSLPDRYAEEIYNQFLYLEKSIEHRRKVAQQYAEVLNKDFLLKTIMEDIDKSSNLRFLILVNNREDLILYLKKHDIFISDIWYDSPIGPKKYLHNTDYKKGECPNSEYISERIINLPTHRNVSEKDARFIAEKVNEWFVKQ